MSSLGQYLQVATFLDDHNEKFHMNLTVLMVIMRNELYADPNIWHSKNKKEVKLKWPKSKFRVRVILPIVLCDLKKMIKQ